MSASLEAAGGGVYRVAGDMNFDTAGALLARSRQAFDGEGAIVLDLAGVADVDSAGLAVMLEWAQWAGERGASLSYRNVPEKLRALAELSDLDEVLAGELGRGQAGDSDLNSRVGP